MNVKKYKITVSEPWDYDGPDGPNLINGVVIKELSPSCLIFKSDKELKFNENSGVILLLKSRYENKILSIKENYQGIVSAGLILSEDLNQTIDSLEMQSKYVLIGQLDPS